MTKFQIQQGKQEGKMSSYCIQMNCMFVIFKLNLYLIQCCCCFFFRVWLSVIRSTKIIQLWFTHNRKAKYWRWETIIGVFSGFLTPLITISIVRILQNVKSWMLAQAFYTVFFKRACFLVVYLLVMGWLAICYGKWLGLL